MCTDGVYNLFLAVVVHSQIPESCLARVVVVVVESSIFIAGNNVNAVEDTKREIEEACAESRDNLFEF